MGPAKEKLNIKNFKTFDLALNFYQKCSLVKIPNKNIRDQFERASLSIVLNISEGYGRITEKDRRRFYSIAFGSLREIQCLLRILNQNQLLAESDSVAACLYQLLKKPGCLTL